MVHTGPASRSTDTAAGETTSAAVGMIIEVRSERSMLYGYVFEFECEEVLALYFTSKEGSKK